MATERQILGDLGEKLVANRISCPGCKNTGNSLRTLPTNFKCADVICDFCGYLAQIKTKTVPDIEKLPKLIPGAAWVPQTERMAAGIYFPLFIVLVNSSSRKRSVWFLPRDLQSREMFIPRKPLGPNAKRAGHKMFNIDLSLALSPPTRVF